MSSRRRTTVAPPVPRNRTNGRIIFKLSAREERELREIQAAREKSRREKRPSRWDALRARLDAQLVRFSEGDRWSGFSVSVREEHQYPEDRRYAPPPRKSNKMTAQARKNKAVFERDNFTCRDCYQEFDHPEPYSGQPIPGLTRGHIIPASMGGTTALGNLIAQCHSCNQALGNRVWNPNILTVPEWDPADFAKEDAHA